MSNFWDFIWLIASTFLFVAYLLILFRIIADLFQDSELGGGSKALWLICLIFLPMFDGIGVCDSPRQEHGAAAASGVRTVALRGGVLHQASGRKIARRTDL